MELCLKHNKKDCKICKPILKCLQHEQICPACNICLLIELSKIEFIEPTVIDSI